MAPNAAHLLALASASPRSHANPDAAAHAWSMLADSAILAARLAPTPAQQQALPRWALLVMIILLLWLVVAMAMVLWLTLRRRQIEREIDQRRAAREGSRPRIDPWTEAARRAATPSASDLAAATSHEHDPSASDPNVHDQPESRDDASFATNPATNTSTNPAPPRPRSEYRPVALITGGARRVGRASALHLARRGFDLIVTYRESATDAESLAQQAHALGARCRIERLDTADEDAVDAFARGLLDEARAPSAALPADPHAFALDALVLNASSYEPTPLDQLSADTALRDFKVNALAGLLLASRLAPLLQRSAQPGGSAIVVMCDIHAMGRPRKGFASYNLSKAAACELVYTLAKELAPRVRVCGVAPGVVAWPEHGHESDRAAQDKYLKRVPLNRAGTPDDAARTVAWLIADATYLTGQIIRVDGGRWIT